MRECKQQREAPQRLCNMYVAHGYPQQCMGAAHCDAYVGHTCGCCWQRLSAQRLAQRQLCHHTSTAAQPTPSSTWQSTTANRIAPNWPRVQRCIHSKHSRNLQGSSHRWAIHKHSSHGHKANPTYNTPQDRCIKAVHALLAAFRRQEHCSLQRIMICSQNMITADVPGVIASCKARWCSCSFSHATH